MNLPDLTPMRPTIVMLADEFSAARAALRRTQMVCPAISLDDDAPTTPPDGTLLPDDGDATPETVRAALARARDAADRNRTSSSKVRRPQPPAEPARP